MCTQCEDLKIEVERLKRELGLRVDLHDLATIQRRFGLSPMAARLALMLHQAQGRVVGMRVLVEELLSPNTYPEGLKVHVHTLRRGMGADAVETVQGAGYRLSAVGRARIYQALQHAEAA